MASKGATRVVFFDRDYRSRSGFSESGSGSEGFFRLVCQCAEGFLLVIRKIG